MKKIYIAVIAVAALTACSKHSNNYNSSTTGSNNNSSGQSSNNIIISNYSFSPALDTVKAGTTVTWTNNDPVTHTVTDDNGSFDSGNLLSGKSYTVTFSTAGTYHYHCNIHTSMKATLIVQ